MNIFVLGSLTTLDADSQSKENLLLRECMVSLGKAIVQNGHILVVCSPFEGAADVEAVKGAVMAASDRTAPYVHFYIPGVPSVRSVLAELAANTPLLKVQEFICRGPTAMEDRESRNYAWLLAQLSAMDRCHAMIAIGGKASGPMSLLLPLAESQRKFLIPLPYLGGIAEECFERQRYFLQDRFAEHLDVFSNPKKILSVIDLLPQVSSGRTNGLTRLRHRRRYHGLRNFSLATQGLGQVKQISPR